MSRHEPVLVTAAGKTPVAAALEAWDAVRAGRQWRFTGPVPKAFKRQALEQLQAYRDIAARADTELNRARYEIARGHLTETEYAEQLLA